MRHLLLRSIGTSSNELIPTTGFISGSISWHQLEAGGCWRSNTKTEGIPKLFPVAGSRQPDYAHRLAA